MKMKAVSANRHALFLLNAALALISAPGTWALNAAKQTGAANEVNCMLTAGYWGQNSVGLRLPREQWEMPIGGLGMELSLRACMRSLNMTWVKTFVHRHSPGDYCDNGDWDILMMSFLHIFKDGTPPKPGLNFAYHCEDAPDPNYPRLLVCQNFTGIRGRKACS